MASGVSSSGVAALRAVQPLVPDAAYVTNDDMPTVPRTMLRMQRWVAAAASQDVGTLEAAQKHLEHSVAMEAALQGKDDD